MSAQIRYREHRGVLILELIGALRASRIARSLVPAAEQALQTSTVEGIVLNLSDLESLDSAGIAELVRLYTMAGSRKLPLAITGAKARILKILEIARLEPFFPSYEDEAGAVEGVLSRRQR